MKIPPVFGLVILLLLLAAVFSCAAPSSPGSPGEGDRLPGCGAAE